MARTRSSNSQPKPVLKQTTISRTSFKHSATTSSPSSALANAKAAKVPKTKARSTVSSTAATERVESDVLLAIYAIHLANIAAQTKNHEYRNYRLRDGVERLWLYEARGTQPMKGCAAITRIPGTVPEEPAGNGNVEFNSGVMESKFGYQILELYELVEPITLDDMRKKYGMGAPMGWSYVKKGMWQDRWGEDDESRKAKVRRIF
ncbi:hypothetical protein G7Z17_g1546 [Cylindrodendrum hubeiense]|uniref:Uncharacterized protein n=1 Tax=Cylindrodendrum hubeiense TaxID=595255 RepID=A0A9P5HLH0_9HYPO|nr:hypothetical protein G7Z17_g1546 [Cylindrodendrum hubeiense]